MSSAEVQLKINQRRKSITNRELLIAASEGQLSEVLLSIKDGADINFIDNDGNTVLHYAVVSDKFDVIEHLIQLPIVDITHENNANVTPLDLARERNVTPIVNLIEQQIWRNALQTIKDEYPQKAQDNTSWRARTSENFMEATFSGNYTVPLQMDDVSNILKLRYLKVKGTVVFVVTNVRSYKEDFLQILTELRKNPKKCIILSCLCNESGRWTAVMIDFNADDQRFFAYIEDPGFMVVNQLIETIVLRADIKYYKYPRESKKIDTGIYALKFADIFFENSNNLQMMQIDWYNFDIEAEKMFLANLLHEKQRTEQKITVCSRILKNLVSLEDSILKLTYQNINAFVLFLETFALEDTYISDGNSRLKEIRKIKKEYFSHFYFQPKNEKTDGKPDYRLIVDARNSLLHCSRILTLNECEKFVVQGKTVKDFFNDMSSFTDSMCTNLRSDSDCSNKKTKVIKCSSFLADKNQFKDIGVDDDLEQLGKFMKNLYLTENMVTDVVLQEIMFDLIVNIIPLLDNKREKIGPLGDARNVLIHNFQKYDSPAERLREMRRLTFPLKSNLFKYFYAKKVHDVLKKYCLYETYECLDSKIVGALIDFEDDTKIIAHVASTDDANSFEFLFEESIFPHKDEAIDKLVEQYFECMLFVDHVTDLNITLCSDDGDQIENSQVASNITELQRREIFEDIVKIKSFQSTNTDFTKNKLFELKTKMKDVGISEECIEVIIDKIFLYENEGFKEQIKFQIGLVRDNILIAKRLLINDLIPIQTLISMYKSNNVTPLIELLRDSREKEKTCIVGKFQSLLRGHFKILFGDDEIEISYVTITIAILKLFYSAFNKYKIKFNNAEEAFKDEIFLNYLISRFGQGDNMDELYAYTMLKQLPKIIYTTPFLVYLHEKYPNILMDPIEVRKLFETCCKDDFISPFLDKFLNVAANEKKINIYEEIVSMLLNKDKIDNNIIVIIMQDSERLEPFLNEVYKKLKRKPSAKVIQLMQMCLEVIIAKIKQLIYLHIYPAADKIIENELVLGIFNAFVDHNNYTVNEFYLYVAKIKNFLGLQEKKRNNNENADKLFQTALIFLNKVSNADTRHKFLVLSRTSFTKQLLRQYDDAFQGFKRLYRDVTKFALSESDLPKMNLFECSIFGLIENSNNYTKLLKSSEDNRKYLDIIEIRSSMAYILTLQCKYQAAIEIYHDLYKYQRCHERYKISFSRTLNSIARFKKYLGDAYRKEKKISEAIKCYIDSLVALNKYLKIMMKIHGGIHPVNREICLYISIVVESIKKCYEKRFL